MGVILYFCGYNPVLHETWSFRIFETLIFYPCYNNREASSSTL